MDIAVARGVLCTIGGLPDSRIDPLDGLEYQRFHKVGIMTGINEATQRGAAAMRADIVRHHTLEQLRTDYVANQGTKQGKAYWRRYEHFLNQGILLPEVTANNGAAS